MTGGAQAPGRAGRDRWWSRRFFEALEAGADAGRLERGRGYAAGGAVRDLKVSAGEVLARVQGSRARPYRVSLIRPRLEEDDWERLSAALAGQPLFRARLLAGELPPEVERVFELLGADLFPRGLDDLVATCSCPDWGHPCKHVAAALYVLAADLDDDPFLLLAWLGRERGEFLSGLRRHARPGGPDGAGEQAGAPFADTPHPAAPAPPALPEDPEAFWSAPDPPRLPEEPLRPEPALFTADPPEGAEALLDALEPLYTRLTGTEPPAGPSR
ncbi:SWIM zinc finger family protein [Nocardiopsis composta]|uniref:Putative Zn finger protein n=1 Tax=Nocardiopsis composta TaxID=157465 RepID=A0A7W8VBW2_9ACTN|nr:SWIM zinc finger family protein [Nocardiopsis composta]MBB5430284.1 putative Zn finger protein [Nocardiopsis composta]